MNKELQFLIYSTPQENVKVDAVVKDETIWLTQKAMATLFGVQIPADKTQNIETQFYNLDAII